MTLIDNAASTEGSAQVRELFFECAASLGFRDAAPYRHNPIAGARYMELVL